MAACRMQRYTNLSAYSNRHPAPAALSTPKVSPQVSRKLGLLPGFLHNTPTNSRIGTKMWNSNIAPSASVTEDTTSGAMSVVFDNESDEECTVISIEGKYQTNLLMTLSGAFTTAGVQVVSASMQTDDGHVTDVFHVKTTEGEKMAEKDFDELRTHINNFLSRSSRSSQPAIYGMIAAAEVNRLRPLTGAANDVAALELTAAEMAEAAAQLVDTEREIIALRESGAEARLIAAKEAMRSEASAVLERKMGAMQAALAARRTVIMEKLAAPVAAAAVQTAAAKAQALLQPQQASRVGSGPATGTGYEILLQGFNWESHKKNGWYRHVMGKVEEFANNGFTAVWMPPPSESVSPQGYLPRDLYKLDTPYGSEEDLRNMISRFHEYQIKVIADIVVNHRCASYQGSDGKWNKFGGRLAWDSTAIACNNPAFGGRGNPKTGEDYAAAPNIDHTQDKIRQDIVEWMKYLRHRIGFDGWRFDFVRGYNGQYCKQYVDATVPEMSFGEYWDSCDYTDGVLAYNQDAHRQRTINWIDSTGGTSGAFDFTTKGILQEALSRKELWRLSDSQGRPAGMLGMWPSRAITFIDNHDTGSTLRHWPFPDNHIHEGYAYIVTHPGTPCIFYDHLYSEQNGLRKTILDLIGVRKRNEIHMKSKVTIRKAAADVYAATIDDKVAMKIGAGNWSPRDSQLKGAGGREYKLGASGPNFAVWEVA